AINAATVGDTIQVASGTYYEALNFNGKNITLRSTYGPELTVIHALSSNPAIVFENNEGSSSVLEGFTIMGGNVSSGGAGIHCDGASPSIRNNIITNNMSSDGGAIFCLSSSPTIEFNKFYTNSYAAIDCRGISNPFIHDNYFHSKNFVSIACLADSTPIILKNIISDSMNWGIYSDSSNAVIKNNLIFDNDSFGIRCNGENAPIIINNTITRNAGGVVCSSCSPIITNSILWANYPHEILAHLPSNPDVTYCNVMGGFTGIGNIDLDPQFFDLYGDDFHLTFTSPCRDIGNNSVVTDLFDFEGDPRIVYGAVDMGADEFYNHLYCTGDFTPSGSIEGKFIGLPATWPVGLFIGSGIMDPPLHHMWGDFYLESPWVLFPLVPIPANGVLEIPATLPPTPAPYDIPMQALIGWELSNLFGVPVR
ncbi:MAG: right-handed parallel beta-helix repeat-containing protein, partial [bacterium]